MKTLDQLRSDGYIFCLPQRTKLDTGIINKLQCRLKCPLESRIILHVVSAYDYLVRGISIVDDTTFFRTRQTFCQKSADI